MVDRIRLEMTEGFTALHTSEARYALLERLHSAALRHGAHVVAFGLNSRELRLVLHGDEVAVGQVTRGLRVGTTAAMRARGVTLRFGHTERVRCADVESAVVWCHRAPEVDGVKGALGSPWTSHRDLLGFRSASFFDADVARRYVDANRVHQRCGGRALPNKAESPREGASVPLLLRLAAAVQGVLPADRRCFSLFTQLARACGYGTSEIADALMLSKRRVRQLSNLDVDEHIQTALVALNDPRLCVVP